MPSIVADETQAKSCRKTRVHKKVTPGKLHNLLGNHKLNPSQASKILNVSENAIYDALKRYRIDVSAFDIDSIKSQHESELIAINALARGRIFDKLLNTDKLGLIEMTAVLDRSFQQLRELQGKGHNSINIFTTIIQKVDNDIISVQVKTQDVVCQPEEVPPMVLENAT